MSITVSTPDPDPNGPKFARPHMLADLVGELVADAEAQAEAVAAGRARGPVSRIEPLDTTLGGYFRPGLHGFTGDPGSGKTALALQVAANCGTPAVYVTAEQAPVELLRKVIARVTQTRLEDVRAATPAKVRELAAIAARSAPALMLLDATIGPAPANLVEGFAGELRQRCKTRDVLLIIDALQPWARGLGDGQEYDLLQAGLTDLVRLTSKLRAPVLVLSHRNRASTGSHASALTAAKGSADFEHMVESALHLAVEKDEKAAKFHPGTRRVNVVVGKNRHGPTDVTIPLHFDGDRQTFRT